MTGDATLLGRLEAYYDLAPRGNADVEEVGPFTLFRSRGGYPYYARPRLDGDPAFVPSEVKTLLARQREIDVPRALEWVDEVSPSLVAAARSAGMRVELCPLLVLDGDPVAPPTSGAVRIVRADDPDLPGVAASIHLGFGNPGTDTGPAGAVERDAALAQDSAVAERVRASVAAGRQVLVGAFDPEAGPVGGGSHNPRGSTSEIAGVGVLPAFRRRGLAGAVTTLLARHALDHGVTTVLCGAQNDDVARIYTAVGFRRVGTACIAEAD